MTTLSAELGSDADCFDSDLYPALLVKCNQRPTNLSKLFGYAIYPASYEALRLSGTTHSLRNGIRTQATVTLVP